MHPIPKSTIRTRGARWIATRIAWWALPAMLAAVLPGAAAADGPDATPGITAFGGGTSIANRQPLAASSITLTVVSPAAGARVGSSLRVTATLASTHEIRAMTARVLARETALTYAPDAVCTGSVCGPGFAGTLDLLGLPPGPHVLEVSVENVADERASDVRDIVLDDPPSLVVTEPLEDSVARPTLDVAAACADDGAGCTISVQVLVDGVVDGAPVAASPTPLSTTLDLAPWDGRYITLRFSARDPAGQATHLDRGIWVDGSTRLQEILRAEGFILDVGPDRVLHTIRAASGDRLFVVDRATRAQGEVDFDAPTTVERRAAFLQPAGAIFGARPVGTTSTSVRVLEWNGAALADHGPLNSIDSLRVAGSHAIWSNGTNLHRRDLAAGQTTLASANAGNIFNSVSPAGIVTFWTSAYQIARYDTMATVIAQDPVLWLTYVESDGDIAVFRRHTPCCMDQIYALVLLTQAGEVVLRDAAAYQPVPGRDYQVHDGWAAFTRPGNLGQQHLWSWSAGTALTQRTNFGRSIFVERVGSHGDVMALDGTLRTLSEADGAYSPVSSRLGKAYPALDGWEVAIGRSLFRVRNTGLFEDGFE